MTIPSYLKMFEAVLPPWLLRTEGLKLIGGIADVIDDHRDRYVAGVKLRFPGLYTLEGIDKHGRDRRLRRGPNETADAFATRLLRWWEDHQTRGNAYALLKQMFAYLSGSVIAPFDVVSYIGVRHEIDIIGTVTRDKITWGTDGSGEWARIWVIIYYKIATISDDLLESYASIVRDWKSAHVIATVVILHPDTRLWGYPTPVTTWGSSSWPLWAGPTTKEV